MLIMGLFGAGVLVFTLRVRHWSHYSPRVAYSALDAGEGGPASALSRITGAPSTWTAVYVVLVVGFLGGATVYAGDLGPATTGTAVIGALVALVPAFLLVGVYVSMRENGRPTAQATAASAITLGLLFVAAISARLVMAA
jgi:hypothetical protein